MAFPAANAAWAEDRIFRFARADIGVAVAVEGGLFTPVVRSADSKSLSAIAAEIRSAEHTSELQSLMRNSYAVFCLKKIMHGEQFLSLHKPLPTAVTSTVQNLVSAVLYPGPGQE